MRKEELRIKNSVTREVDFISGRVIRKPRPKMSCCGAPVSRENDFLFFDGAVDVSKVIAKRVTGIGCSLLEVTGEVQLCAQRTSGLDGFRLLPLPSPNFQGGYK